MRTTKQFREDLRESANASHRLGFEWEGCQQIAGFCVSEVILKLLDDVVDLEIKVKQLERCVEDMIRGDSKGGLK